MNEESICEIVDLSETGAFVKFCQNKMDVDEVLSDPVHGTESHFPCQRNPRLHGMKLEIADLTIAGDKGMEEIDRRGAFALQKIGDRELAARMRLIPVDKLLPAFGTNPHGALS